MVGGVDTLKLRTVVLSINSIWRCALLKHDHILVTQLQIVCKCLSTILLKLFSFLKECHACTCLVGEGGIKFAFEPVSTKK